MTAVINKLNIKILFIYIRHGLIMVSAVPNIFFGLWLESGGLEKAFSPTWLAYLSNQIFQFPLTASIQLINFRAL